MPTFAEVEAAVQAQGLPAAVAQSAWDYLLEEDAEDIDTAIEMAREDWED